MMKRYRPFIFGSESSVAGRRYDLHHMLHTGCGQQYAALHVTHFTENKYHIYNFNAAGNFKLLQLKCGLLY